ncbi:spermine oxidase [Trichonephila clavipes]|nr:spermine oxidase [Trichonephila clavipes]
MSDNFECVHPVLLFAGEAAHDKYYSTVHGAYETGIREAERIFQHYRNPINLINNLESMADISLNKKSVRDNFHVVIVGAGISGLSCALQLYKNNFSKITILEAQDKVGGRISTVRFNDCFLELGAQWIHGCDNLIFDFSKANKLIPEIVEESACEGKGTFCTCNGNVIEASLVEEVRKVVNDLKSELEGGQYDAQKVDSVSTFFSRAISSYIAQFSDDSNIDIKRALFDWCMKFESIDNAARDLNDIAVQSFTEWDNCPEELYHIEFSNGFHSFLDTVLSQLPNEIIHLKTPVKCIKWSSNLNDFYNQMFVQNRSEESFPILLECDNEERFYADSVIVTASIGFLKENIDSFFSPPLPQYKLEVLANVGFETVNKIFLIYDEPFWKSDDLGFQLVWENTRNQQCEELLDQNPWIHDISGFDVVQRYPNILLGWIGGKGAVRMESIDEEAVGNVCSDLLRIFLKRPDIPNPSKVLRSSWYSDPYIRGSYSSRTTKYYEKDTSLSDLQHPLYSTSDSKNRGKVEWPSVLFAGEAYDKVSFSSAHGAFQNGIKVADELMKSCLKMEETAGLSKSEDFMNEMLDDAAVMNLTEKKHQERILKEKKD